MPGFKGDILNLARALGITADQFDAVGIHAWPSIMKRIEAAFIIKTDSNTKFNWWWESFKGQQVSIFFEDGMAFEQLSQLVDAEEPVWFIGCDTDRDPSKFWLFEGTINPIQQVISEFYHFEYYIVSKKYEWLLCETDHSVLTGLGSVIPKMKRLKSAFDLH
ncbi:hypothetical protein F0P96_03575 [Hymenobacter busanensis]|uniref:Uncharacterized protein n=1 Tax=Hymenobacter busanensis TaxID=2607656 RepID=A0A7L4ZU81_9BACT|nr:DUF6756 family protein [Hymenobacter busanensis]KAA9339708.1 hypothetical protein F0P96_03575 [Hymenobacter busanensis]QHJ06537.1 hypothetical protein GUY19_04175 [Hymenobacter busanensis]